MSKICICDLDGVVANVDARFARAKADAEAAFVDRPYEERAYQNIYWRAVFDPEQVPLDTLIDGVNDAIERIEVDYQVIYLTSRPESMRSATYEWLVKHRLSGPPIVMKPPAFQYTKTTVWKAGMVQTLESLYGATDLLIVEDEDANIQEHLKYFSNVQTREICKSLAEAVAKLHGTWVEPDPFAPEGW